jgi:hypothetical protein
VLHPWRAQNKLSVYVPSVGGEGKRGLSSADREATEAELAEAMQTAKDPVATAKRIEELKKYAAVESLDCTTLSALLLSVFCVS